MAVFDGSRRHIWLSKSNLLSCHFWTSAILFITSLNQSHAWDNTDLELFDLVEEVSQNFYEVLGLDQSANQGEIRRAYRRLSLQYHPDKNKEEGAEERFRQLVAVAEVLRDEDKRRRYDDILLNGLPDWRQPVYYYRRVRKMGLLEATTLLSIILTVGHYIVMWSMYWERKFELESLIKPKREKKSKKVTKSSEEQKPDAYAILEDPTFLPKPQITDCLPFKCYRLSKASIFFVITSFGSFYKALHQKFEKKPEEPVITSDEEEEEVERKPRVRQKVNPALYDYNRDVSVEHLTAMREALVKDEGKPQEETKIITKNVIWTQAEVKLLIKSIAKFPGGTVDRWEKIAAEIGRPLNEVLEYVRQKRSTYSTPAMKVTKKAKEIKNKGYATAVDASIQGITGSENHTVVNKTTGEIDASTISIASSPLEDQPITCEVASYDYFDDEEMSKKKRRHKGGGRSSSSKSVDRTEMITGQNDQERTVKSINSEMDSGNNVASDFKSPDEPRGLGEGLGGVSVEAQGAPTKPEAVEEIVFDGVESCSWTQRQQKILEKALQVYPKGTPERWDKIAGSVPGKSKEECILRYKELVEIVRRKKMAAEK